MDKTSQHPRMLNIHEWNIIHGWARSSNPRIGINLLMNTHSPSTDELSSTEEYALPIHGWTFIHGWIRPTHPRMNFHPRMNAPYPSTDELSSTDEYALPIHGWTFIHGWIRTTHPRMNFHPRMNTHYPSTDELSSTVVGDHNVINLHIWLKLSKLVYRPTRQYSFIFFMDPIWEIAESIILAKIQNGRHSKTKMIISWQHMAQISRC